MWLQNEQGSFPRESQIYARLQYKLVSLVIDKSDQEFQCELQNR